MGRPYIQAVHCQYKYIDGTQHAQRCVSNRGASKVRGRHPSCLWQPSSFWLAWPRPLPALRSPSVPIGPHRSPSVPIGPHRGLTALPPPLAYVRAYVRVRAQVSFLPVLHKELYVLPVKLAVTKVSGAAEDSTFMGVLEVSSSGGTGWGRRGKQGRKGRAAGEEEQAGLAGCEAWFRVSVYACM